MRKTSLSDLKFLLVGVAEIGRLHKVSSLPLRIFFFCLKNIFLLVKWKIEGKSESKNEKKERERKQVGVTKSPYTPSVGVSCSSCVCVNVWIITLEKIFEARIAAMFSLHSHHFFPSPSLSFPLSHWIVPKQYWKWMHYTKISSPNKTKLSL